MRKWQLAASGWSLRMIATQPTWNILYFALILGDMPDAPKLTLRHMFQSVWCNQLVAGVGRTAHLHLATFPWSWLAQGWSWLLPSRYQSRRWGRTVFFGRCVSCIRFLPCHTSSESLSKLGPKDFMPAWFYIDLASSKLDFGCKHLLRFAKPRLSILRGLFWGLFYTMF